MECDEDFEAPDDEQEPEPRYFVYTRTYYGHVLPHGEFDSYDEARECADKVVRRRREAEFPVTEDTSDVFGSWEIEEPPGCSMIPSQCGTLVIRNKCPREWY